MSRFAFHTAAVSAVLLAAGWSAPSRAQDGGAVVPAGPVAADLVPRIEDGKQIYEAVAFARFGPQTALDMVRQIPGFVISQTSGDRGLGEASQNVLINGQRISGKSNDAETVLGRTLARTIVRFEISDGAALNIPGLSGQVLNVITKIGGISGNYLWNPQFRQRIDPLLLNGEINVSGRVAGGNFTLGLSTRGSFRGGGWGTEIVTDAAQNLLYTRDQFSQFSADNPKISGSFNRVSKGGAKFNINAEAALFNFRRRQEADRFTVGAANPLQPDITELGSGSEAEHNYEISGDYEFGVAGGRLKLVGYRRFEHSPNRSQFRRDFADGSAPEASQFNRTADEGETIARGEFTWKSGKSDWSISAEAAFNFLDSRSELFLLDNGIFISQPLGNPETRVAERRGQLVLSYGRPLSAALTLQAQIGGEYSELAQTGAGGLTRQFIRPKGQFSLAWKATPKLDVSARLQRRVGQLNFFDFLESVDLRDDNNNVGNPNLVPPQSWLGEVELNRKLGATGSIKLKLQYEQTNDLVEQIPIAGGGEAPGNLTDGAQRWSAETNITLLFDPLGWKGAKLDLSGFYQKGRLTDPLTGVSRRFGAERRWTWSADFRHDIRSTNLAYGIGAEDSSNAEFLRLNFLSREFRSKPLISFFAEHKDILGLKLRASLINLTGQTEGSREIFFTTSRLDGRIDEIRDGTVEFGVIGRLSISGTF